MSEMVFSPSLQPAGNSNKLYLSISVVQFPIHRKDNLIFNTATQKADSLMSFMLDRFFTLEVLTTHQPIPTSHSCSKDKELTSQPNTNNEILVNLFVIKFAMLF